jgi:hypothetical protein
MCKKIPALNFGYPGFAARSAKENRQFQRNCSGREGRKRVAEVFLQTAEKRLTGQGRMVYDKSRRFEEAVPRGRAVW